MAHGHNRQWGFLACVLFGFVFNFVCLCLWVLDLDWAVEGAVCCVLCALLTLHTQAHAGPGFLVISNYPTEIIIIMLIQKMASEAASNRRINLRKLRP